MLGIKEVDAKEITGKISLARFSSLKHWGIDKILNGIEKFYKVTMPSTSFSEKKQYLITSFRGKSPKYKNGTNRIILNQKCNRWNYIDERYAKTVDEEWYDSLPYDVFLQENDIIINSTGEGTLGRASLVTSKHVGSLVDSHVLVLRLNTNYVLPELIVRQINSKFGQQQVHLLKGAQATNQTELGIDNLLKMKFIIPLDNAGKPDLAKQRDIFKEILQFEKAIENLNAKAKTLDVQAKKDFENAIFN